MKVEIIHDTLAKRVYNLIDAEDRMWLKVEQFVQNRHQYFLESGAYLTRQDLKYIQPYFDKIQITEEQRTFIENSRKKEKKKSLGKRIAYIGGIAVLLITAFTTFMIYEQKAHTKEAQKHAWSSNLAARAIQSSAYDQTLAYKLAKLAYDEDPENMSSLDIEVSLLFQSIKFPFYHQVIEGEKAHQASIVDLAISKDHQHILSADMSGMVYVHSINGNPEEKFQAHQAPIYDVDFIFYPHGAKQVQENLHIFTASSDSTAKLWDLNGKEVFSLNHGSSVNDVSLSSEKGFIITVGHDGYVKKWSNVGREIDKIALHEGQITSVDLLFIPKLGSMQAFADSVSKKLKRDSIARALANKRTHARMAAASRPKAKQDDDYLITADDQGTIKITNLNTRKTMYEIPNEGKSITNSDYDSKKSLLAVGFEDGTLKLWRLDVINGAFRAELKIVFKAHEKAIQDLVLEHVGDTILILTSSEDNRAILWDEYGNKIKTLLGHRKGINAVDISIYEDHKEWLVLSGGKDKSLKLWRIQPYEKSAYSYRTDLAKVVLDSKGNTYGGSAEKYTLAYRDNFHDILTRFYFGSKIKDFAVSPDAEEIMIAGESSQVIFWNKEGVKTDSLQPGEQISSIETLAYSPDGSEILISSGSKVFHYNRKEKIPLKSWGENNGTITVAIFSPDGNILLGSSNKTLTLYDPKNNYQSTTYTGHSGEITTAAFMQDGKRFISGCADSKLILWDIQKEAAIKSFIGHSERINHVAVSQDNTILSASDDHSVWLWNSQGIPQPSVISHNQAVLYADFSADGKTILSVDEDQVVKVWNFTEINSFLKEVHDLDSAQRKWYLNSAKQEVTR